jgi:hypothetical protein
MRLIFRRRKWGNARYICPMVAFAVLINRRAGSYGELPGWTFRAIVGVRWWLDFAGFLLHHELSDGQRLNAWSAVTI